MAFRRSRVRSPSAPFFLVSNNIEDEKPVAYIIDSNTIHYMRKILVFLILSTFLFEVTLDGQTISVEELKKQVAAAGKLEFRSDLPVKYLDRSRLKAYVDSLIDREYSEESARKESRFLYLMGFLEQPVDLKSLRKKILVENAGGFYNEKTGELFILEEFRNMNMINSLIVVHELRHAIQDQHVDLSRLLDKYSDFDDRKLAVLASVEGDAMFVMAKFSRDFSSIPLDPELLTSYQSDALMSFSPLADTALLHRSPDIIKFQLMMPYIEGLKFTNNIYKRKKWKGVNHVLKAPPVSSEQILHPEKYLKNEVPVEVTIIFKPDGYQSYHSGVVGEYMLNILLRGDGPYVDHADGWGGDAFTLFQKEEKYFLLWESCWDSEKSVSYFFYVFKKFLETNFRLTFRSGKVVEYPFLAGQSRFGYFFLWRQGKEIFYARSNDRIQMNKFISGGLYD